MAVGEENYRLEAIKTGDSTIVTNRLAIPFMSKSELLETFHLDDVLMAETEGGTVGFTGLVNITGDKYALHNVSRIGSIKSENINGEQTCYLDAGLNTLGIPTDSLVVSAQIDDFKVRADFISAFFVDTINVGVKYRINGQQGYTEWFEKTENYFSSAGESFTIDIDLPFVMQSNTVMGDDVEYSLFITNAEGRYDDNNIKSKRVTLVPINLRFGSKNAPLVTYWTNTQAMVPADNDRDGNIDFPANEITRLYTEQLVPGNYQPASAGNYYLETVSDFYWVFGSISNLDGTNYLLYGYNPDSGQEGYQTFTFIAYGATSTVACRNASIRPSEIKVYRPFADTKFYTSISFNTLISDGYYIMDVDGRHDIYQSINGVCAPTNQYC